MSATPDRHLERRRGLSADASANPERSAVGIADREGVAIATKWPRLKGLDVARTDWCGGHYADHELSTVRAPARRLPWGCTRVDDADEAESHRNGGQAKPFTVE